MEAPIEFAVSALRMCDRFTYFLFGIGFLSCMYLSMMATIIKGKVTQYHHDDIIWFNFAFCLFHFIFANLFLVGMMKISVCISHVNVDMDRRAG